MPALTHGRVINGFNMYPRLYKSKLVESKSGCFKKIYYSNGTIIPLKYINTKSIYSRKAKSTSKNKYKISQRGIGDSINKNILNRKIENKCKLYYGLKKKILCEKKC